MLQDGLYNLMNQMVEESRSLKRIEEQYKNDAGDCDECKAFWSKMKDDKEAHIAELRELVKKHI